MSPPKKYGKPGRPAIREPERERRLDRIEQMMLRGIKNQAAMARAFGISECMLSKDVALIRKRWGNRDPDERELQRREHIVQIEDILRLSLNAFDRSRKDIEEFSISIRPCDNCNGAGRVTNRATGVEEMCRLCGGKGKSVTEVTKVKETPGDPSFLKLAKECVVEVARMQGVYPDGKIGVLSRITETEGIGGNIREKTEELYLTAPTDTLIEAMAAIDRLKRSNKKSLQNAVIETSATREQAYDEGEEDEQQSQETGQ